MHLLLLLLFFQGSFSLLQWVSLSPFPGAVCNDGSPAGYYFQKNISSRRFLVYLEGGGFCYDNTSCTLRWKDSQSLMSSKSYPASVSGSGILSSNKDINPDWYDANIAFVKYCSSDSYSGTNPQSDLGWAFQGSRIVDAVFHSLLSAGIRSADLVLFSGTSAGAEGLYPNSDRMAKFLGPSVKFRVLIDSGWFLDWPPYREQNCDTLGQCTEQEALRRGVKHWRPQLNERCAAAKNSETMWECMLGHYVFDFIEAPCFVFAYQFDAAGLGHDGIGHQPNTPAEINYSIEAARNMTKSFEQTKVRHLMATACYRHGLITLNTWNKLMINQKSLGELVEMWFEKPETPLIYQDSCYQPNCNPTCHLL